MCMESHHISHSTTCTAFNSRTGLLRYSQNGPLIYLIGHTYLSIGYLLPTPPLFILLLNRIGEEKKSMGEKWFSLRSGEVKWWLTFSIWPFRIHFETFFSVFLVRAKIFLLFTIYSVFFSKTWTFMKIWNCFSLANLNEHGHCSDANSECPSFSQIFLSSTILWMWIAVNVSFFLFIYSYSHILGVNFILIWIFMYSTLLLCSRTIVINFCGFFPSKFIFNFNFVYIFFLFILHFFLRRRWQTFRVKKLIFRVRCHHQFYVIARFELLVFSNRLSWVHTEFY